MVRRILVPYDQSEQADYALAHAVGSFEAAEVVLFHVVEPFADHTGAGGSEPARSREYLENAERTLEAVREEYADRARIETVVRYGRPAHAILNYAEHEEVDHVVIGSHGRDGAARLLLGSVAETVARRCPAPVTVVRKPPAGFEPAGRVLVPFDASEPARRALTYALEEFEGADVTALYVAEPTSDEPADVDALVQIWENWADERADRARRIHEEAEAVAADHDATVVTEDVEGRAAAAITDYAEREAVDHVVIGSTGRDGVQRLLLGSVAETVVRRSPVTVTIVKETDVQL